MQHNGISKCIGRSLRAGGLAALGMLAMPAGAASPVSPATPTNSSAQPHNSRGVFALPLSATSIPDRRQVISPQPRPIDRKPDSGIRFGVVLNCLASGLSIAVDAMAATLTQIKDFTCNKHLVQWVAGLTASHITLPMVGLYMGTRDCLVSANIFAGGFYMLGCAAMTWLTFNALGKLTGASKEGDGISSGTFQSFGAYMAALCGVSVDALVHGIGVSSMASDWSQTEVYSSFPIKGLVVGLLVGITGVIAKKKRDQVMNGKNINVKSTERFLNFCAATQLVAFSYFAATSLFSGLEQFMGASYGAAPALLTTALAVSALGVFKGGAVLANSKNEALELANKSVQ